MKKFIVISYCATAITVYGSAFGYDILCPSGNNISSSEDYHSQGAVYFNYIENCREYEQGDSICNSSGYCETFRICVTCQDGYNEFTTTRTQNGCTFSNIIVECSKPYCDGGYYLNSDMDCVKCPNVPSGWTIYEGGVNSSNGGEYGITDCYVEGQFNDGSGHFEISGDSCNYNN